MIKDQLSETFFNFIKENEFADVEALRLKYHGKATDFDLDLALIQIECRKKCRKKLASFIKDRNFIFPSVMASEQASHQAVAGFHAMIVGKCDSLLDMTAGLGIDVISMGRNAGKTIACEKDEGKASVLAWNIKKLNADRTLVIDGDSVEWLKNSEKRFSVIFIDPSRRGKENSRLYSFHDCQPDVLLLLPLLFDRCNRLLIKASPLLDISQTLKDIKKTSSIRAISVNGECKEILIDVDLRNDHPLFLEAINLSEDGDILSRFSFIPSNENNDISYASEIDLSEADYLYEPDASVMKLSPWKEIGMKYSGIKKLGKSSHLFISNQFFEDFPGRKLRITGILNKKEAKSIKGQHFNVATRNYPVKPEDLRKKYALKEGTSRFLYGTRLADIPVLISAEKI